MRQESVCGLYMRFRDCRCSIKRYIYKYVCVRKLDYLHIVDELGCCLLNYRCTFLGAPIAPTNTNVIPHKTYIILEKIRVV